MWFGFFHTRRRRNRYDLVCSRAIFRDFQIWLITLIGIQTSGPDGPFIATWIIAFIGFGMLTFFVDIAVPTLFHNSDVYLFRKEMKRRGEERKAMAEGKKETFKKAAR